MDSRNDKIITMLAFDDTIRNAHPGAVYYYQGQAYKVVESDLDRDATRLQPTWADYHTRVLHSKHITVERDILSKPLSARSDVEVRFAEVTMRKQITKFERRDPKRGVVIDRQLLGLPEASLWTKALYSTAPSSVESEMRELSSDRAEGRDCGFSDDIRTTEYELISLFPLRLFCDRGGIGRLLTPYHAHTDRSTIFIYDGHPDGVGITRTGYDIVRGLMRQAAELISDHDCEDGCPSYVRSPQCRNANDPLAKAEAVLLLESPMETRA